MKTLIIGQGEVGTGLYEVLSPVYETNIRDIDSNLTGKYKVVHIAYPFSQSFVKSVLAYQRLYKPRYTVIHSTVPVGTSERCQAYYSPVRGVHPNLREGLLTFDKYLAPRSRTLVRYFEQADVTVKMFSDARDTEAAKLWDTTYYGWCIAFQKAVYAYCQERGLDFDTVYSAWNESYNAGYQELGMSHVVRPVLKQMDGKIGGHCVMSNAELLDDNPVSEFLIDFNEAL